MSFLRSFKILFSSKMKLEVGHGGAKRKVMRNPSKIGVSRLMG